MNQEHETEKAITACVACGHRVIWHHDERGCQYLGNGPHRCVCRRNSEQVVAGLLYEAMTQAADRWFDARLAAHPTRPVPPVAGAPEEDL